METYKNENLKPVAKAKAKCGTDNLRVRKETKKRILVELATLNKKDFGKPITADQYVALGISLLGPAHLKMLQDQSLTAHDRFEQRYKEQCIQHGKMTKDEFLASLLK